MSVFYFSFILWGRWSVWWTGFLGFLLVHNRFTSRFPFNVSEMSGELVPRHEASGWRQSHCVNSAQVTKHGVNYLFIWKGSDSGTTRWQRSTGQSVWEGARSLHSLLSACALPLCESPHIDPPASSPASFLLVSGLGLSVDWAHGTSFGSSTYGRTLFGILPSCG